VKDALDQANQGDRQLALAVRVASQQMRWCHILGAWVVLWQQPAPTRVPRCGILKTRVPRGDS